MSASFPPWLYQTYWVTLRLLPLIALIAWCLWGINWRKAWPVLAMGGWIPFVLIGIMAAMTWSLVFPRPAQVLGIMTLPNGLWQSCAVALLLCVVLFCGWLQTRLGWYPPEISLEPPAHHGENHHGHDDHGHSAH